MHVESFMEAQEVSTPLTEFLDFVRGLIPPDKYRTFLSLLKFPLPTVKLTGSIFKELERVFDSRNPSYNYQFTDPDLRDDWEDYRKEFLNSSGFWRSKGWDAVRTSINSVLIVDLPEQQATGRPEPYFYLLGIENVIDYKMAGDKIEYILFKQPNNKIAVFDDESYRVYSLDKNGKISELLVENKHELGYCPASFFWTTPLTQTTKDLKKSPLSDQVSDLDKMLFFEISKEQLDLYAAYPIYSGYQAQCDFENPETFDQCDGGFLRTINDKYIVYRDGSLAACPVCEKKKIVGVGAFVEVPAPTKKDDPDLRNPVSITTVDKDSLNYNVEELKRKELKIFTSAVGTGGDVNQKQSINEMQVTANFESKTSVLNSLKGNLEKAIKFVNDTCCRLRYSEAFINSSISLGTEFYIYSISDLYEQYKQAKENGASEAELDSINEQILATEHRNNPMALQRMIILKHLEPYRHYTFKEILDLNKEKLLNPDLLQVKLNFNTFVDRFERENTNVIEFGSQLDFDKKVKIISETLINYGKENRSGGEEPGAE